MENICIVQTCFRQGGWLLLFIMNKKYSGRTAPESNRVSFSKFRKTKFLKCKNNVGQFTKPPFLVKTFLEFFLTDPCQPLGE